MVMSTANTPSEKKRTRSVLVCPAATDPPNHHSTSQGRSPLDVIEAGAAYLISGSRAFATTRSQRLQHDHGNLAVAGLGPKFLVPGPISFRDRHQRVGVCGQVAVPRRIAR